MPLRGLMRVLGSGSWALLLTSLLAVSCLAASASSAEVLPGTVVDDFALLDQLGHQHQLSAQADVPVVVLYSYATACPIARQNLLDLQLLQGQRSALRIFLLDSTPEDERAAISAELQELGVTLPVLLDPTQNVARALAIDRTGECLVIRSADWTLRWRGPCDDRVGYGAQKATASAHYLADAIDAVVAGTPPASAPAAKGCKIASSDAGRSYDYAADVAPIIAKRCLLCHCQGGVAPFALDSLRQVLAHRAMISETVRTRRMPPWAADPAIGSFIGAGGLSVDEERTLVHWIELGARHAAPARAAAATQAAPSTWPLGEPDLIIECPPQAIPASGALPYRRFELPLTLPADTWVGGYDLRPSDARVMHHGFAFLIRPGERADPRDGRFTGLSDFFANYVPGCPPALLPVGTGKFLPQGSRLSFQLHYTTCGVAVIDHPRLALYFLPHAPARELMIASARAMDFTIAPGEREHAVQASWTTPCAITLYGMAPHMHLRGSWMRYDARYPDGHHQELLNVPHYDVNWQWLYRPLSPLQLPAGTTIVVSGAFDNSRFNELNPDPTRGVRWGTQTWDEMFIGYFQYAQQ